MIDKESLARGIYGAGNNTPVIAIHSLFKDAEFDDVGYPLSKTATALLSEMAGAGMIKLCEGVCTTVQVDASFVGIMDYFGPLNNVKIAGNSAITERLLEISGPILTEIQKLSDEFDMSHEEFGVEEPDSSEIPSEPEDDGIERAEQIIQKATPAPKQPKFNKEMELETWKAWKKTNDPKHLSTLLKNYEPLIQKHARIYQGAPMPKSIVRAEAQRVAMMAFDRYDPSKGVQLNTFVTNYMPKVGRFVNQHANVARIPEEWKLKIRTFKDKESEFESEHGRSPTSDELADELHWHIDDVAKMRRMMRADVLTEHQESPMGLMKTPGDEKAKMFLDMLYLELPTADKTIFEHIFGMNGRDRLDTAEEIAKATNKKTYEVYEAKKRISDMYKRFAWLS